MHRTQTHTPSITFVGRKLRVLYYVGTYGAGEPLHKVRLCLFRSKRRLSALRKEPRPNTRPAGNEKTANIELICILCLVCAGELFPIYFSSSIGDPYAQGCDFRRYHALHQSVRILLSLDGHSIMPGPSTVSANVVYCRVLFCILYFVGIRLVRRYEGPF